MLINSSLQNILFVIYNTVIFYGLFFIPIFYIATKIFYYYVSFKYSKMFSYVLLYNIFVSFIYIFFPDFFHINNYNDIIKVLLFFLICNIPISFIVAFNMFYNKQEDSLYIFNIIRKRFLTFFIGILLIYNIIFSVLMYLLYYFTS